MAGDQVHEVRVHLTREQAPIRTARLEMTGTDVTFGVPGWQGEHYGFAPGSVPKYRVTLDDLVAPAPAATDILTELDVVRVADTAGGPA